MRPQYRSYGRVGGGRQSYWSRQGRRQQCLRRGLESGPLILVQGGLTRRSVEQEGSFGELEVDIDAGRDLDLCSMEPGVPGTAPCLDREAPVTHRVRSYGGLPAIQPRAIGGHAH